MQDPEQRVSVQQPACHGGGAVHGQNPDFENRDPAEIGFILGAASVLRQTGKGGNLHRAGLGGGMRFFSKRGRASHNFPATRTTIMLKGISPLISPDLLAELYRMGHGDEIVLADAHFPGDSMNPKVLRADGLKIPELLDAILPLFELDPYVAHPLIMMAAVEGDTLDPAVEESYLKPIRRHAPAAPAIERMERFAFYDRAKSAFAVLMTGETAKYGNIILKKGVTPVS